ncbi:succinoglycan biosynthesis protein ExoU [Pararhizobium capsulatum DSM 1112]|uniref:Succinoglycan biosynthesis protein ExoU n=1 Tax=Pararhizobium capsulatum DSM 1112 TaxID=1121113 RepID=A0ABU0BW65_9HYPH|nr:glycosyltransferase [Pararhizobium capsulatum]MDQ0322503.1 succinoglycan biosynthesis protein ExoU [Pararhizobium capsulatum DSM 1112]
MDNGICVIIAAMNAAPTIARAVETALREPETIEVIVIDDGSRDDTIGAAKTVDDGSGRLRTHRFEQNRGPAAARNMAIEMSKAEVLSILDADDFLFPGRFRQLLAQEDWDFVADNIAFVDEEGASRAHLELVEIEPDPKLIDLKTFVEGNISKSGVRRGEIGFLKPLMRRAFLDENGLRYREDLRLGEDYDLYARALAAGARYKVIHSCGYGAVVRGNSLSGSHRTEDLRRLYEADRAILSQAPLSNEERRIIRQHEQHIRARYELRHFLDLKKSQGFAHALSYAVRHPAALPAIAGGIFADKSQRFRRPPEAPVALGGTGKLRYLLTAPAGRG